ncbi:MAG: hypothetical protein HY237_08200 [Acidobacteria bacterium]|nr:hypothetical protein [Acidobacteriota bacterium]
MESYPPVLQVIYDAIEEVNGALKPEERLEAAPGTILIGEGGTLSSLCLVNFIATLEERIERVFHRQLSLVDVLMATENSQWTVATLAERLAELLNLLGAEQHRAQILRAI